MGNFNFRKYGDVPYEIAVVHGGPGAGGEMAPVARKLAEKMSVLEPIQTRNSLYGQIEEFRMVLEEHAHLPVVLIGYSWGAWLCYLLAATYPSLVRKLILISSAPFEDKYVRSIRENRINRLGLQDGAEFCELLQKLQSPEQANKDDILSRLGKLVDKADIYDQCDEDLQEDDMVGTQGDIFQKVWSEAAALRKSGELLKIGEAVQCPTAAIHGVYDPHPAEGVEKPLSFLLNDFKFISIEKCGHTPWKEKQAKAIFYQILEEEIKTI